MFTLLHDPHETEQLWITATALSIQLRRMVHKEAPVEAAFLTKVAKKAQLVAGKCVDFYP